MCKINFSKHISKIGNILLAEVKQAIFDQITKICERLSVLETKISSMDEKICHIDQDTDEIKIWIDTTDHEPYCLSKEPIVELEKLHFSAKVGELDNKKKLTDYAGFKRFEEIKKYDLSICCRSRGFGWCAE